MGKTLPFFAAVLLLGLSLSCSADAWSIEGGGWEEALSLDTDPERGLEIYKVCAACHLPEGWGTSDGLFPQLAGQIRGVLIKQLADIRSGNRENPTMLPFTLPGTIGDAQSLADVVAYIESLPMNPDNGKGDWIEGSRQFDEGKALYEEHCIRCHGKQGEGSPEHFYPLIQGQHYKYMLRQFEWIRDGKRRNANPEMVEQIEKFTYDDMKRVINYVSRIPVPRQKLADSPDWKNPDFN